MYEKFQIFLGSGADSSMIMMPIELQFHQRSSRMFRTINALLVLMLALSASACGGGRARRAHVANERAIERQDDRADARFEKRTGWEKLGERIVNGGADRDVIPVGRAEGKFSRINVVVEHSSLEMFDIVVRFGDGTEFSPQVRHVFGENTRSRVIDLPGDRRVIRAVEFRYGNLPGGGRAQIELWAQ